MKKKTAAATNREPRNIAMGFNHDKSRAAKHREPEKHEQQQVRILHRCHSRSLCFLSLVLLRNQDNPCITMLATASPHLTIPCEILHTCTARGRDPSVQTDCEPHVVVCEVHEGELSKLWETTNVIETGCKSDAVAKPLHNRITSVTIRNHMTCSRQATRHQATANNQCNKAPVSQSKPMKWLHARCTRELENPKTWDRDEPRAPSSNSALTNSSLTDPNPNQKKKHN